jgi:imidazolonepropionase-like amidohydrolase
LVRGTLIRLRLWTAIAALIGCGAYFLFLWPLRDPRPAVQAVRGVLAVREAKIYVSPDAPPIEHGTVLVRDGAIVSVGADVTVPPEAQVLPCDHCVVMAGFWNAHIHFTERKWSFAAWKGAATLNAQLADMLTSRGFTTVVDAGSDLRVTISLRRRIESSGLLGPAIYTAGAALYPPRGVPYYLKNTLPFYLVWSMPQPATAEEATRIEERNIANGADLLKLFTGSYVQRGKVLPMPETIARAAAEVAHRHGQLVYSHPSDLAGTKVAINSGVDVLAHAPDTTEGIDAGLLGSMVGRHMAMVPTLKMFATTVTTNPAYLRPVYAEVRQFHALGGELLFGTDVGYMTDYSTEDEFRALAQCGLNARDILRMLTTAPARRFGAGGQKGSIAPGKLADLVVLDNDPEREITAFAHVRFTVRNGRLVYAQ